MCDSFIVYRSFYESIQEFDDKTRLAFYDALLKYGFDGIELPISGVAKAIFTAVKPQIDANAKRRANGNLGGRPKKEPMVSEENNHRFSETETNGFDFEKPNVNVNVNDNVNVNENANENVNVNANDNDVLTDITEKEDTNVSKKEVRHKYGQYQNVLLSDSDMEKLKEEFPCDWEQRIERLSEYIESKGAKYKNHLATIRAWARKNNDKKQSKVNERPYAFRVIDEMDFGEGSMI